MHVMFIIHFPVDSLGWSVMEHVRLLQFTKDSELLW